MKGCRRFVFILFIILPCLWMKAEETTLWTPETLPMVHLQDAQKWVCNPDGILSTEVVDSVDLIISRLEQEKDIQAVVVVVRRTRDNDCYSFCMALAKKYGIGGKNTNRGLIMMVSTEDREYRILTGTGLEGTLPDAICKRVELRIMVPHMKVANWDGAILGGMKAIAQYIDGDETLLKDNVNNDDLSPLETFIFMACLMSLIGFFILIIIMSMYKECPRCKKKRLYATKQSRLYTKGKTDYYSVTYICSHCGHTETKIERRPHSSNNGIILGGSTMGGRMGEGGFGGGFGGGSFGGGSFGGGGAGGRF